MAPRSLPYLYVLGAIAFVLGVFLWVVFDTVAIEILAHETWEDGGEDVQTGRDRVLSMWDVAIVMMLTSISFSLIIASRRRG